MTDLDKLKELFNSWGVPHKPWWCEEDDNEGTEESPVFVLKVGGYEHQSDPRNTVTGYTGFYTTFKFDQQGKFICMGAWE